MLGKQKKLLIKLLNKIKYQHNFRLPGFLNLQHKLTHLIFRVRLIKLCSEVLDNRIICFDF